jgi:hypothetical protein
MVGGVIMFRLFDTLLIGLCLLCINLIVLMVGTMTGWLPGIFRTAGAFLRNFFFHSYQAYNWLFTWLAPTAAELGGIDILHGWVRVMVAAVTSILILGLIILILGWTYPLWLLALAALHGIVVGIRWERLDRNAGFRWGVDL